MGKSGARLPELAEFRSAKTLVLDEPLPALLPQATNATVKTSAKGKRNRSLLRLPEAVCPVGWLCVELFVNASSAVIHWFCAAYVSLDAAVLTGVHGLIVLESPRRESVSPNSPNITGHRVIRKNPCGGLDRDTTILQDFAEAGNSRGAKR